MYMTKNRGWSKIENKQKILEDKNDTNRRHGSLISHLKRFHSRETTGQQKNRCKKQYYETQIKRIILSATNNSSNCINSKTLLEK